MPLRNFLQEEYLPSIRQQPDEYQALVDQYNAPRQRGFWDYALPIGAGLAALGGAATGGQGTAGNILGLLTGGFSGAADARDDAYERQRREQFGMGVKGLDFGRNRLDDIQRAVQAQQGQDNWQNQFDLSGQQWQQGQDNWQQEEARRRAESEARAEYYNRGNQGRQDAPNPYGLIPGASAEINNYLFGQHVQGANRDIDDYNTYQQGFGGMQGPGVEGFGAPSIPRLSEFGQKLDRGAGPRSGDRIALFRAFLSHMETYNERDPNGNPIPPDPRVAWEMAGRLLDDQGVGPVGGQGMPAESTSGGMSIGGMDVSQARAVFDDWDQLSPQEQQRAYNIAVQRGLIR